MKENKEYWERVRARARARQTDGCTGVADIYVDCCYEHDIHCDGYDINGNPINWAEAAARLRRCIQQRSFWGQLNVVSYWWWAGVRFHGWRHHKD